MGCEAEPLDGEFQQHTSLRVLVYAATLQRLIGFIAALEVYGNRLHLAGVEKFPSTVKKLPGVPYFFRLKRSL